jgi:hypothetical protein
MADTADLAVLAASAYYTQRSDENRIYAPSTWALLERTPNGSMGFEASAYRNGNEIVISFAGTDQPIDWYTNVGSGLGFFGLDQLKQAAAFYAKIQADYGGDVTYTFTAGNRGQTELARLFRTT